MINKKFNNTRYLAALVIILIFSEITFAQSKDTTGNIKVYTIGFVKNIFRDVDLGDAQAATKVWINELVKLYHYSHKYFLKSKIYSDLSDAVENMQADQLACIGLTTYDYLTFNNKADFGTVLVPEVDGNVGAEYYLLVNKNSNIKNLEDLKGKAIGLPSRGSETAAKIWLDVILAKKNLPAKEKYFSKIIYSEKNSQVILNLFFNQTDACVISENEFNLMKELNPQVQNKLVSIITSPRYLWTLLCFTKYFNEDDRTLFYNKAIEIQTTSAGRQLFSMLKMDKLVPFKKKYLDNYKTLLKDYNHLVKPGK